jgi:hypothetical protein
VQPSIHYFSILTYPYKIVIVLILLPEASHGTEHSPADRDHLENIKAVGASENQ